MFWRCVRGRMSGNGRPVPLAVALVAAHDWCVTWLGVALGVLVLCLFVHVVSRRALHVFLFLHGRLLDIVCRRGQQWLLRVSVSRRFARSCVAVF